MLVKYVRKIDEFGNLVPFACIVATGTQNIGYSVCSPKDSFNKERARTIALGRAQYMLTSKEEVAKRVPSRTVYESSYGDKVDQRELVNRAIDEMIIRAGRYFKE